MEINRLKKNYLLLQGKDDKFPENLEIVNFVESKTDLTISILKRGSESKKNLANVLLKVALQVIVT
jgi:hypothetical protein